MWNNQHAVVELFPDNLTSKRTWRAYSVNTSGASDHLVLTITCVKPG